MCGHTRRFNPSHQWVHQRIAAGELDIQQMDVQTYFFRRTNTNALGQPRSWTDHLLWHHAAHTVDLFEYQTGGTVVDGATPSRGRSIPSSASRWTCRSSSRPTTGAICTLSLSFNNDGPFGTFFRYIGDTGTYVARYDDLVTGHDEPIDVSHVDVSMNGIELQDREFVAAIREGREPNSSVAQVLPCYRGARRPRAQPRRDGGAHGVIIDCHGHYTTTPPGVGAWRDAQVAEVERDPSHVGTRGSHRPCPTTRSARASRARSCEFQRERGSDLTLFSPRASWMGHHIGNEHTSLYWSQHQNDLIRRVCDLYPDNFAPVCQLPQSPGAPIDSSVVELEPLRRPRWVSSAATSTPTRRAAGGTARRCGTAYWWPLWEKLCELDVPAMIHVSASCNEHFFTTGSHYLGADTTAFMQALSSGFMSEFPGMRWIIPHGGGAVPYHWGRFKGIAADNGMGLRHPARPHLLRHVRVPPAGDRPAPRRRADRQHPVRIGDGRRRPRDRPGDRQLLRRHQDLHRQLRRSTTPESSGSSRTTPATCTPAWRCDVPANDPPCDRPHDRTHADPISSTGSPRWARRRCTRRSDGGGYLGADVRPIQQGTRVAGTAVTVLSHPGDNLMIHAAIEMLRRRRHPGRDQQRAVHARHVR